MMKNDLVVVDYQGLVVSFSEEGWFNATEAASKFGKRVADWLENAETKTYINILAEFLKVPKKRDLIKANRGKYGGTWMHPKLAVAFARWLDPNFGVWCDLQIDNLIRGQHPHYNWKRLRHEATSSFKVKNEALRLVREAQGKACAAHHYQNESKLINYVLTGKFEGIDRNALSDEELTILSRLEVKDSVLIGHGFPYDDRKTALKVYAAELRIPQGIATLQ